MKSPKSAKGQYTGGLWLHKADLVRSKLHAHTTLLDDPLSPVTLGAINAIQATPWRINKPLLVAMETAVASGLPLGGLEMGVPMPLPPRQKDAVWEAMTTEERQVVSKERMEAHAQRSTVISRRATLLDKVIIARRMVDHPAIWFAHTVDFRHRIYPLVTGGPSPQGNDHAKALLEFAEGKPLGPDGFMWLCIRAANCAGQDKLGLTDRVQWAFDNMHLILGAAQDPLANTWWAEQDEPWQLLATCLELAQCPDGDETFVSHLPCQMDGTCNGLQHLSAMGLDTVGAEATNLLPGPRRDIYGDIAALVSAKVDEDAAAGELHAATWVGHVGRDVVKRAVMTTPYGVTKSGISRQLVNDDKVPEGCNDVSGAAQYLRDCLVLALGQTVSSAREIMGWLQETAKALATAEVPFEWETPAGSRCLQAYYHVADDRIQTLVGRLRLRTEVQLGLLNPKKNQAGSAPNFVHSFDAAHMALTVVSAVAQGVSAFSMIHDSYGTHAADTTTLAATLREEFARMYETDWIAKTHAAVKAQYPHVEIPDVPLRGELDVSQVRHSDFFFS